MKKIIILTGGSKGIGEGIVSAYLSEGFSIYSLSRSYNHSVEFENVNQISVDLLNIENLERIFLNLLSTFNKEIIEKITLINNAGTLGEVSRIEHLQLNDIEQTFKLNSIIPIHLSSLFIQITSCWKANKSIINISSGASENAKFGWSIYCASKAALNLFSQSIAKEQLIIENGVKIVIVFPGVVDTSMQEKIRGLKKSDFIEVENFIEMKNNLILNDIFSVGKEILKIDHDKSIENGQIIRIIDKRLKVKLN